MKKINSIYAVIFFLSALSCTTTQGDPNAIPTPEQAAAEASAHPGYSSSREMADQIPQAAYTSDKVVRLRFKESLLSFAPNSANFTPSSRKLVRDVAKIFTQHKQNWEKVEIHGHSDANSRHPQRNQELSDSRAKAVASVFESAGVEADRISFEGHAASQPLIEDDPKAPENRRVELLLLGTNDADELLKKLKKFTAE